MTSYPFSSPSCPPKFQVQLATSGVMVTQCPIQFQWTLTRNSIQFWIPLPQLTITTGSPPPSHMVLNMMVSTQSDLRAQLNHSEVVPPSWTNLIKISSATSGSQTFTILSLPAASGNLPCVMQEIFVDKVRSRIDLSKGGAHKEMQCP